MKKRVILNIGCTTLCQLMTLISGLIVPRLILSTFGSEANGLVSSLTQFLNYISLVEGGIGSVVLTALYGPLAKKDDSKLSSVLKAAEKFFRQIAYIFVVYTIILACAYPIIVKSSFSWIFVASLTLILSFTLFIQYFFYIQTFAASGPKNVYCTTMASIDYLIECSGSCCFNKSIS